MWWTIALPFAVHALATTAFLLLTRAYRRDPDARTPEAWRRRYIGCAALTGIAYGGGAALLVSLPPFEPRLVVTVGMVTSAALAPGRLYEPRSYVAFAGLTLLLLALWPGLDAIRRRSIWRRIGTADEAATPDAIAALWSVELLMNTRISSNAAPR